MLVDITIYNKEQRSQYSFLVDLEYPASVSEMITCLEEDLERIIDKELALQPKGYYGVAKNLETDLVYYCSYTEHFDENYTQEWS